MVVSRTYSAPLPFMRGRMNLIQRNVDDESNEFVKPDPSDFKSKVPRTRSYNFSRNHATKTCGEINKKAALPLIQRRGRFHKKNLKESNQTGLQRQEVSQKRRKPRVQSGAHVQNIKSRMEFQKFSSRQPDFPVHIRDTSFRTYRLGKLQEQQPALLL